MIVDVLFLAVKAVLAPIFTLLPTFSLVDTLGLDNTIGKVAGSYMHSADGILPLHEIANMIYVTVLVVLPCLAAYKFANWVWRHIPDLWGFGPGAG